MTGSQPWYAGMYVTTMLFAITDDDSEEPRARFTEEEADEHLARTNVLVHDLMVKEPDGQGGYFLRYRPDLTWSDVLGTTRYNRAELHPDQRRYLGTVSEDEEE